MNNKIYIYECENCGKKWKETDKFKDVNGQKDKMEETYQEGYICPKCKSNNIKGNLIKE